MNDAWSKLAPHRPLRQGDPHYAKRPDGGGEELAGLVRAGWKRIAVVGPMGIGKSTELAAAQQALMGDRFAFRVGLDLVFDMRRLEADEALAHILTEFLKAKPDPSVHFVLNAAADLFGSEKRGFRRDLTRKALRLAGKAALLVDGLEKAPPQAAQAIAEELFGLSDDADIVLVIPPALAFGPTAALLAEDVRLFPIRPALVWGEPRNDAIHGRLFLREIAMRHLEQERLGPTGSDALILELIDRASVLSGGVPRVLLQLLRDAHRHAIVARREIPTHEDLMQAAQDQGEQLRRSLVKGDQDELRKAEGSDGNEIELERKLRFLLQGHLLEYKRGERTVMHTAPTLADRIGIAQERR